MEIRKLIGRRVREARTALDMSQGDLKQATGIPQETISRIENGGSGGSVENLVKIASAVGVRLSVLIDPENDEGLLPEVLYRDIVGMLESASDGQLEMVREVVVVLLKHTD